MIKDLKNIEKYLRDSGFVGKADEIKVIMDNMDGALGGIGGGTGFGVDEGQPADDVSKCDLKENNTPKERIYHPISQRELRVETDLPKTFKPSGPPKQEQDNVDAAAMSNGIIENSVTQHGGLGGLYDSYFYQSPGSIERNM